MAKDGPGPKIKTYHILREIGRGGNAIVYLAHDERLNRPVAIKMLHAFVHHPYRQKIIARFYHEAQEIARLQHPNILPVYDFGEWQGAFYIVTQYVPGKTLRQHLLGDAEKMQAVKPLSLSETLNIVQQVGAALAHAHQHGIIHRDVKPSNILMDDDGHIYLTDYGLAHIEAADPITQSGETLGTPHYVSPEQGKGLPVDHRSDIYSLGVILFHMLTGQVPFHADTPAPIILKHMVDPLPSPRSLNPKIPLMVEVVLRQALAKNPSDRYQTVQEFIRQLEQAIASYELKETDLIAATRVGMPPVLDGARPQVDETFTDMPGGPIVSPALSSTPLDRTAEWQDYALDTSPLDPVQESGRGRTIRWAIAGIILACLGGLLICTTTFFLLQNSSTVTPTLLAAVTPPSTYVLVIPTPTFPPPTPELTHTATIIAIKTPAATPTSTAEPTQVTPSATPTTTPTTSPTPPPPIPPDMVLIPAGDFIQGSSDAEIDAAIQMCDRAYGDHCPHARAWFTDETPRRTVYLDAFYIDRWEVSNRQFLSFVAATGYRTDAEKKGEAQTWQTFNTPGHESHPAVWISWNDANAYCQWAGKRLPTEAEWEKAARGTGGYIWAWGSSWETGRANTSDGGPGRVTAVGSYPTGASPYDVMDMTGNVWEWVADWYAPNWYTSSPMRNPGSPPQGVSRVLRGGSFRNPPWEVRAVHRHSGGPDGYAPDHGFRCAK
jgi:serine/threonine protein kinase